jgi:uncharacterized protein YndB with AHSA1/START domain
VATDNGIPTTTFTMPSDEEISMTRVFDAPAEVVFDAWTSPDHVPQWMVGTGGWDMVVCEVDLRPGGEWRYVWRRDDGTAEMGMRGTYEEVDRPQRLVRTETFEGWEGQTVNTLELSEDDGKTTITHTVRYPSKEERDKALQARMREGSSQSLDRLAEHLQTIV